MCEKSEDDLIDQFQEAKKRGRKAFLAAFAKIDEDSVDEKILIGSMKTMVQKLIEEIETDQKEKERLKREIARI